MSGSYFERPKIVLKLVRPFVPAVTVSWPTSSSQKIRAVAWVRSAKYGPRMRRRNTSHPSSPATSIGTSRAAAPANHRCSNGRQISGSSDWLPYRAMNCGSRPGSTCSSDRYIPMQ